MPSPILPIAAGGLLTLGTALAFSLGAARRQDRRQARIAAVVGPHRLADAAAAARRGFRPDLDQGWFRAIAGLIRLQSERRQDYPIRWWIIPLVALPFARAAAGLVAALGGDLLLLLTPVFWVVFCRMAYGWLDARRVEILFQQFPDALGMVTRAVRVGIPVSEAIRSVAREAPKETAAEFKRIGDRLSIGQPMEQALAETAQRNNVPEYRFFATALALQNQTGGALGETLENLAEVIRKRVALKERGYALAAEARTSAGILAALPFFTCAVLAVMSPAYVAMLFEDAGGRRILAAAIGLLLLGIAIMRSMIRRALS